jgi:hypothetical protein
MTKKPKITKKTVNTETDKNIGKQLKLTKTTVNTVTGKK